MSLMGGSSFVQFGVESAQGRHRRAHAQQGRDAGHQAGQGAPGQDIGDDQRAGGAGIAQDRAQADRADQEHARGDRPDGLVVRAGGVICARLP